MFTYKNENGDTIVLTDANHKLLAERAGLVLVEEEKAEDAKEKKTKK